MGIGHTCVCIGVGRFRVGRRGLACQLWKRMTHYEHPQSLKADSALVLHSQGAGWQDAQQAAAKSLQERNSISLRALDVPFTELLGPRVEHLIAQQPGLLSDTVAGALELPKVLPGRYGSPEKLLLAAREQPQ